MSTTLIALHGFTQNGAHMRNMLAPLAERLPANVTLECPTAPNACAETSVERMYKLLGGARHEPPHCCWFDATDDGREYRGFEQTKQQLTALIEQRAGRVGLLAFSQGAIAGTALAALCAHGRFPKLDFVILVAGRPPRSDELTPLLDKPIAMPSLHVWGERDPIGRSQVQPLLELFDSATRHSITWPGPHIVPTRGVAADAILSFIAANA
jgi:predicted esterase